MAKTKTAKRQKDIKSKLIAAICMLLVSTIMMVSSTYAWFTLSTAPEVTGITTAVGANGNLEMALMPKEGIVGGVAADKNYGITSNVGDSVADAEKRNVTWGNLVDLSNSDIYGLDQIKLYPATLNLSDATADNGNPMLDSGSILQTPEYGADGRISVLAEKTVTSLYDQAAEKFNQKAGYGVRALGNASGMTDRQLDYRNLLADANTYTAQAKRVASTSLQNNGDALANIAVTKAMGGEGATYTSEDVTSLEAIVDDLLGYEKDGKHVTGVLEYIDDAYKNYLIAYFASKEAQGKGITDEAFSALKNEIENAASAQAAITAVETKIAGLDGNVTAAIPAEVKTFVADLEATKADVNAAKTELDKITADTGITWGQLNAGLQYLAKIDSIKVNGFTAEQIKNNMSDLINSVAGSGILVTMESGAGVYADVADHCGNYIASIKIKELSAGGLTVTNVNARMETKSDATPANLNAIGGAVTKAEQPSSAGGQVMPISDFYGYIIDLAFRTNAAESNLLLQTTPTGRIYEDNQSSAETMGAGSTMTFESMSNGFTSEQMVKLMESIRVVFFDPVTGEIFAYAKLDMSADKITVVGGNQVTASLYLYEVTADTTTYTQVESEEKFAEYKGDETVLYTKAADSETYAPVTDKSKIPADANYRDYYTAATTAGGETLITTATDAVITALTQNEAKAVSVLVYLEGKHIENADVAANVPESMSGTLNLQFASSATLVPMNYTPLQSQGGAQTPENGGENGQNP